MRRLGRDVRRGDVEIVVISADRAHRFHGFTGELVAGMIDRDRLATPLDEVMPLARIIVGRAVDIDADRRRVSYRRGDDATVEIAAVRPPRRRHRRQGADGGGRGPRAATASRCADPTRSARSPTTSATVPGSPVVVAGGGVAGVELAAAIADRGHPVTLVHSAARVLGEWDDQPRLVARAEAELARLGVTVLAGRRAGGGHAVDRPSVGRRRAGLRHRGGRDRAAPRAHPRSRPLARRPRPAAHASHPRGHRGRVGGGRRGARRAPGDAARRCRPTPSGPSRAATTSGARSRASCAGAERRDSAYRGLGRAASFGLGKGIAELYGIPFTGALAWLLRLVFFLRFMPSRRRAAGVVSDLARFVLTPRAAASAVAVGAAAARRYALAPRRPDRRGLTPSGGTTRT